MLYFCNYSAVMKSPVKMSSLAFYFPIILDIKVPPKLGNKPNFISGNPNLVYSLQISISHNKASSNPPPKANELTHAIIGLLNYVINFLISSKLSKLNSYSVFYTKSLILAPAQKNLGDELFKMITFIREFCCTVFRISVS